MYITYSHFPDEVSGICTICGNKTSPKFDLCKKCYERYHTIEIPSWLRSIYTETQRRRRQHRRDKDNGLVSLDHISESLIKKRML